MFTKGSSLYEGKAKRIFHVQDQDDLIWLEFKDDLTAFNALKKGTFENKGPTNLKITELIFKHLDANGVSTHWVEKVSDKELVVKRLKMIPLEVIVRNFLAGSTAKKFQIEEGLELDEPLFELFYKEDSLNDPFINNEQALFLKAVESEEVIFKLKEQAFKINSVMFDLFKSIGIKLVDFKIEFGLSEKGEIVLGDEISPDSCRLWDMETDEKKDKDRFRRDLGNVKESYEDILSRLEQVIKY